MNKFSQIEVTTKGQEGVVYIRSFKCGPDLHWSSKEPTMGHQRVCSAPDSLDSTIRVPPPTWDSMPLTPQKMKKIEIKIIQTIVNKLYHVCIGVVDSVQCQSLYTYSSYLASPTNIRGQPIVQ